MMEFNTFLIGILTFVIVLAIRHFIKFRHFPPGPPLLPLVGSIPFIRDKISAAGAVAELILRFGHNRIFGFAIGTVPIAVVQDYELAQEMFTKDEFCGRPQTFITKIAFGDGKKGKGVIFNEGRNWTEQRRFSLKSFREFGFGKTSFETVIREEANFLVGYFKDRSESDVRIDTVFNVPVVNVLWKIVANKRFELDDPKVKQFMVKLNEVFKTPAFFEDIVCTVSKWFFHLPFMSALHQRLKIQAELGSYLEQTIEEHLQYFDENAVCDFIDMFIKEMKEREGSDVASQFDLNQLKILCTDFFIAGSETTSTTLRWTFLWLTLHQDVQEKCRKEISDLVHDSRSVSLSDEDQLPFCSATILEILRISSILPLSVLHRCTKDSKIENYFIPKDSIIFYNINHMQHSEEYWDEPNEFKPERFLSPEGKVMKNLKAFLPFGFGKRICLGKSLALNELFIFFTTILQNFKLKFPKSKENPDIKNFSRGVSSIPDVFYVQCEAI